MFGDFGTAEPEIRHNLYPAQGQSLRAVEAMKMDGSDEMAVSV
jgi:hypothetical protein